MHRDAMFWSKSNKNAICLILYTVHLTAFTSVPCQSRSANANRTITFCPIVCARVSDIWTLFIDSCPILRLLKLDVNKNKRCNLKKLNEVKYMQVKVSTNLHIKICNILKQKLNITKYSKGLHCISALICKILLYKYTCEYNNLYKNVWKISWLLHNIRGALIKHLLLRIINLLCTDFAYLFNAINTSSNL